VTTTASGAVAVAVAWRGVALVAGRAARSPGDSTPAVQASAW